jgi:hypothetical protein
MEKNVVASNTDFDTWKDLGAYKVKTSDFSGTPPR